MGVRLIGVCLMVMRFRGIYFIGMDLTAMHLMSVSFGPQGC